MTQELAKKYLTANIPVVPVPIGQKGPILKGWPDLNVTLDTVELFFPTNAVMNVGGVLGKPGSNLADLDLDCPEALYFADIFAPDTGFIYGRKSNPKSHRIFTVTDGEIKTRSFKCPTGMLVEVLGKNHAVNLPGSFHETGEEYELDGAIDPSEITTAELYRSATLIATCSLMAREWPSKGGRNEMAMCFAGALCKAGFTAEEVETAVFHTAKLAKDEEANHRRKTALDTVKKHISGKPVKGMSGLREVLPDGAFKCLNQWLDISIEDETAEVVDTMNARYAYVVVGGKPKILVQGLSDQVGQALDFISLDAFRGLHKNKHICVGYNSKGPIYKSHAEVWFEHPDRRTYEGIAFEPGKEVPRSILNLYRGFGVEPTPDPEMKKFLRFLEHWHQVVCGGEDDIFEWVIAWLADAVQNPGVKPGTAIILTGKQGCGKSSGVEYLEPIFKHHYMKISDQSHLHGKFNAHQQGVILMLGEEISLSNKSIMGIVKDKITSPTMVIERKGMDAIIGKNCLRLILTSNEQLVIPAEADDRRFLVLNVSDKHVKDFEYFAALVEERDNGGAAALLDFLLEYPCADVNLREPPQTSAMIAQKIGGLEPVAKALYKFLLDGHIHPKGTEWPKWIATQQFQAIALKTIKLDGLTAKGLQTKLGSDLQKYLGKIERVKQTLPKVDEDTGLPHKTLVGGNVEQQLVYLLPDLEECRKRFTLRTSIPFLDDGEA